MIIHDKEMMETTVDGIDISLTRMEHRLLSVLMDGKLHTRSSLLARVWKADITNKTRTLDVTIGRLKVKLGSHGKLIKTFHGVGYKLRMEK